MKRYFSLFILLIPLLVMAQIQEIDSLKPTQPLINLDGEKLLKNIDVNLDLRLSFVNHFENGRTDDYTEFRNSYAAIGVKGKVHRNIGFHFRYRFNKEGELQSLDILDKAVELAFVDMKISPKTHLQLGKMFAYFGGYEYEYNPIDIIEYNDVLNQLLNYVTGLGVTHQLTPNHSFGFQALNSRTMRYADLYEGNVDENVQEPNWPLALVVNWRGKFFDGKFETIYSLSRFRIAKGHATTHAISLGNKFHSGKFKLMYDFNYSNEQLDTKGILTSIIGGEKIAQDAVYIDNWMRAEYEISPKIQTSLTLMTSNAYGKNVESSNSGNDLLRTSYGLIPTIYYQPFPDINVHFYLGYIVRFYQYSNHAKNNLGITNYNTGELQIGLMAPLLIF